jgi:hypothetical protein
MASVVIAGDTSGTVTLAAPATAGTTTLTLPTTDGTVVVTGTTPTLNGITFPATQVPSADANTLDDYEEGTWTCTVTMGSGSATLSSGTNTGAYTKIGRQVTVTGDFNINAVSSPSGSFTLNGLPFAIDTSMPQNAERTAGVFVMNSFASNDGTGSLILESGTTPFAKAYQFSNPVPDSSTEFWISLTYFTS